MPRVEEAERTSSLTCWSFVTTWMVSVPFDGDKKKRPSKSLQPQLLQCSARAPALGIAAAP